jgi:ppGpp synthetase/RelA/SpoT-type nucleotidyltranferase
VEIIDEFLVRYTRERDYYARAASIARDMLDGRLFEEGVRAIVSARAKSPARLRDKLLQRAKKRTFASVEEIRTDLVDLAGARVALYFPGDRYRVNRLIAETFDVVATREFPRPDDQKDARGWKKRFSGYGATHHRAHLRRQELTEPEQQYAEAMIEIQVASVLMHAWSEVEHDLVYKPLSGELSVDELAILDELNGVILAGEIALERLEASGERRITASKQPFRSPYDVATVLIEHARTRFDKPVTDAGLGRTDLLLELLGALQLDTREKLGPFLDVLDPDVERRPLSEQVIEHVVAADPDRAALYQRIQRGAGQETTERDRAIGSFVRWWALLEQVLSAAALAPGQQRRPGSTMDLFRTAERLLQPSSAGHLHRLRQQRNLVIHKGVNRDAIDIHADTEAVRAIVRELSTCSDPDVSAAASHALEETGGRG